VFERDGYLSTGVADIVAEAGVARGSFYTYFPAKIDVFRVVADEVTAVMDEALSSRPGDESLDVIDGLRRSHERYMEAYRANAAIYALTEQLAHIDDEITARRVARHGQDLERIAGRIRRWQVRGLADPAVDPRPTAAVLLAMTRHTCYWLYVRGDDALYTEAGAGRAINDAWIRTLDLRREPNPEWLNPR
jgi:AcrR family transcriptional regulator